ncbi:MAG: O-antigen ligase family protein [Oscillospiraceae bacterium]|jgi:O-antigen ligase|nr:O-antigen ligase family protein [Oscillospiraceae bacterium]
MLEARLNESVLLRFAGRFWARFLAAARESFCCRALLNSRILARLLKDLPLASGLLIGLLFVIPHDLFNNLLSFAVLLLVTGLVLLGVLNGSVKGFAMHRMGGYMAVFWFLVFLNGLVSPSFSLSLRFLLFHLTAFLGLLVTRTALTDRRGLTRFVAALLAAAALSGLYGCFQSVTGVKVVDSQVDVLLNINMPGRIYSFFENPNNFAEILVLTLPLFAALFFAAETMPGKRAAFLAALPAAASLLLTFSRSGWMAFGLSVVIFFYLTHRWVVPVLLALALAAVPVLPASIRDRVFSMFTGSDSSIQYRAFIRGIYRPEVSAHWLGGSGLGSDVVRSGLLRYYEIHSELEIPWWRIAPHAHNLYLQIWAELGIAGAASFAGAMLTFFRRGVSALFSALKRNYIAAAGLAGLAGALVIGFVEYVWFYPRAMLMFWLVAGITLSALRLGGGEEPVSGPEGA